MRKLLRNATPKRLFSFDDMERQELELQKQVANVSGKAEYFLSIPRISGTWTDTGIIDKPLSENPAEWELWYAVPLGELTRDDAEHVRKRAKELRLCNHVIHTVGEVDRYQLHEALQAFQRRDALKLKTVIEVVLAQMKECVKDAEGLRGLPSTLSAPANNPATVNEQHIKSTPAEGVKLWIKNNVWSIVSGVVIIVLGTLVCKCLGLL